jgi:hypothetical protein
VSLEPGIKQRQQCSTSAGNDSDILAHRLVRCSLNHSLIRGAGCFRGRGVVGLWLRRYYGSPLAALKGQRNLLAAPGEPPDQLGPLLVKGAFEDDRGRLDFQAHGVTINRDCVNRDSRALIEAV